MTQAKLTIWVEDSPLPIVALFNPEKLTISKSAPWRSTPRAESDTGALHFTSGEPARLSLDLFFDTYEKRLPVTLFTDQLFHLTTVEKHGDLHRPPLCKLQWGLYDFGGLDWILESLDQTFTLFLSVGIPVRARLSCSFRQWRSDEIEARLLNLRSADVAKTHTVRRGETLASIARDMYDDPTLWRPIAEANGIHNPRLLQPGRDLIIPKLAAGARRA